MRYATVFTWLLLNALALSVTAADGAPELMNYQGILTDANGDPLNGDYDLIFAVYPDSSQGAEELWSESHDGVPVVDGLFNVILGDHTAFPVDLFLGSERWMGITVGNDPEMTPRMRITSVPWAMRAAVADSALAGAGGGADSDWIISDDSMYSGVPGFVGVGTNAPLSKLHVEREDRQLAAEALLNEDLIVEDSDAVLGLYSLDDGGVGSAISLGDVDLTGVYTNKWSLFRTAGTASKLHLSFGSNRSYAVNPKVMSWNHMGAGIGVDEPECRLDVQMMSGQAPNYIDVPGIVLRGGEDNYGNQIEVRDFSGDPKFMVDSDGDVDILSDVGIGTTQPHRRLEVSDTRAYARLTSTGGTGQHPTLELKGYLSGAPQYSGSFGVIYFMDQNDNITGSVFCSRSSTTPTGITIGAGGTNVMRISSEGKVGIGNLDPSRALTVRGNLLIESETTGAPVVELGEGLDYAEGFDVVGQKDIEPGTVLIIDSQTPGKLTACDEPYDRRVAGIVAGGRGLGSGVRLGVDQFDCDVALAGRVYCNVVSGEDGIEPGDLLTTSDITGHAMKVTDHPRAQGSILGKAMEPLEPGRTGQIMVLVTLQ